MKDVFDWLADLQIDTKNRTNGSYYTKCPKCHDSRKKKSSKELLVNIDWGYCECFHCGWSDHILHAGKNGTVDYTPAPAKPQKFISPEPMFNWIIPDAVIDPLPSKPMRGTYNITWYYRNIDGKLTGAKKMEYNFHDNGWNRTEKHPLHLYTRDDGYVPCLFYERDLYLFPSAKVILIESEKTAAIMRKKFKDHLHEFIFIATCGANGLSNDKVNVLAGRYVLICYDCDKAGREGAESALNKITAIGKGQIIDISPEKTDGTDLADIEFDIEFLRSLKGERKYPPELINSIRKLNQAGEKWTRETADKVAAEHMVNLDAVFDIGRVYYDANRHEFSLDNAPLIKQIEHFLLERYEFKRNSINKRVFYRERSSSSFVFCNYNDIWRLLQHNIKKFGSRSKINITDVSNLLESDFVKEINPFHEYFNSLPHWDGIDHISALANYIQTNDQDFWVTQFKKALIRMIACSYGNIENRIIMVLVQPSQRTGKDSFIRHLCPPELREYYKEDPLQANKDTEIALCQNFLWNLTELDQLNKKEISEIKGIISRATVKQRKSYGRQEETMLRTVSFWGSTNKDEFLTDTQNTRWLCFRVNDINWAYNNYIDGVKEIDITKVWSQAWYLYKTGTPFNLDINERQKQDLINHSYEIMPDEKQLILKYLTPCAKDNANAEFMMNVEILQYLNEQTNNKLKLIGQNVGRSMTQLDFIPGTKKINNTSARGYYVLKQALKESINNPAPPPPSEPSKQSTIFSPVDPPF